jgi:ubiquinone/menaquinone biosynthesis C-methylase UbiE
VLWRFAEIQAIRSCLRGAEVPRPILDLGTGDGKVSFVAFGQTGVDLGIDMSSDIMREAKKIGGHRSLILADASKLPFRSGSIGMVFSNSVLEHIPNLKPVLYETQRVLMNDGIFVATVPNDKLSNYFSVASFLSAFKLSNLGRAYSSYRNKRLSHYHCESIEWWKKELTSSGLSPLTLSEHLPSRAVMIWDVLAIMVYPISYLGKPKRFAGFMEAFERATRGLRFSMINLLAPTFLSTGSDGAVLAIVASKHS